MKHDLDYEGLVPSCPKCGWEPQHELFYHISLSVYLNNNKLPLISCRFYKCTYKGTIIDWLTFHVVF